MRESVLWAALLLAVGPARAQERGAAGGQDQQQRAAPTSDAFDRACIDLLHGRTPQGEQAIRALKDACSRLMAGRAEERIEAEERRRAQAQQQQQGGARVEPGQAAAPVQPGGGVLAAFEQAGSELVGRSRRMPMGMRRGGPVGYTLITNPVGWFNGLGVNAELHGSIPDYAKFSWVTGARFSQTDVSTGTASTFGALGGVDYYIIGRNNEGLRIGPRIELAAGREDVQGGDTNFGRMSMSGELGYNFIASNGITGLLAGGLGGRVAGDEENEDFESFVGSEFGPYIKVGLGYSW